MGSDVIAIDVNLGATSSFVEYNNGLFTIEPKEKDVGVYSIFITLNDQSVENSPNIDYTL